VRSPARGPLWAGHLWRTVAVLATGTALGIIGVFVYLALRSWLPTRGGYRSLVFVLIVLGFGLFVTIDGNQEDFVFLNTAVSIASFAAVLLLYALVVPPVIDRRQADRWRWRFWRSRQPQGDSLCQRCVAGRVVS
jgi:hypothetical protein